MLYNKEIIPNIRYNKPNPKINFEKGMMKVQTDVRVVSVYSLHLRILNCIFIA